MKVFVTKNTFCQDVSLVYWIGDFSLVITAVNVNLAQVSAIIKHFGYPSKKPINEQNFWMSSSDRNNRTDCEEAIGLLILPLQ